MHCRRPLGLVLIVMLPWLLGVATVGAKGVEDLMALQYVGATYTLEFDATSDELIFRIDDGRTEVLRLKAAGSVRSFDFADQRWENDPEEQVLGVSHLTPSPESPSPAPERRWVLTIASEGRPWAAKATVIDLYPDRWEMHYELTAPAGRDVPVHSILYGGAAVGSGPLAEIAGSSLTARRLYHWNSDRQEHFLTTSSDFHVELQSSVIPAAIERQPSNDMGRFVVPPYVASFESRRNGPWWGVGTLETPQAATGLEVHIRGRTVHFAISPWGAVEVAGGDTWETPTIAFFAPSPEVGSVSQADDVISAYTKTLFETGRVTRRSSDELPAWWFDPIYTTWGDQIYLSRVRYGNDNQSWSYVNEAQVDAWLAEFESKGIPVTTVILDAGWDSGRPVWGVNTKQWPDLRGWIDRQHEKGRHVLLWIAPYWGANEFPEPFPGFYIRNALGQREQAPTFPAPMPDFSSPQVREWFAERLRHLLSDEPGAVNADGLKIDFFYDRPDPRSRLHDPSWGVGEAYNLRTLEWIYQTAKSIKEDALITMSAANPFFNTTSDLVRMNDNWSEPNAFALWTNRARSLILAGGNVMDSDDWHAYLVANGQSWVEMLAIRSVLSVPSLLTSKYRETQGRYVEPSEGEWRAASALLQAYRLSPTTYASRFDVRRADGTFRRYSGESKDLEALTLADGQGAVFYRPVEDEGDPQAWDVYVVPLTSVTVTVPLQPGAVARGVYRVELPLPEPGAPSNDETEGVAEEVAFAQVSGGDVEAAVRFAAEAASEGAVYRIRMVRTPVDD